MFESGEGGEGVDDESTGEEADVMGPVKDINGHASDEEGNGESDDEDPEMPELFDNDTEEIIVSINPALFQHLQDCISA